jgi:hypothetical protein
VPDDDELPDRAAWLRFGVDAATLLWSSATSHEPLTAYWARSWPSSPPVSLASYRTPKGLRVSVYAVGVALLEHPGGPTELRKLPFMPGQTHFERATRAWIPKLLEALARGDLPRRRGGA